MNYTTVVVGGLMLAFGLFSALAHLFRPSLFRKLEPMKARWGPRLGVAVHVVGYVVVPLVAGSIFVSRGLQGVSVF